MAVRINRERRKELGRRAQDIRQRKQRAGWPVERIVSEILTQLPEVLPLEAWRWAYGWSRAGTIEGIANLYGSDHLAAPNLTSAMLCRWEHGQHPPSAEYAAVLCRLYQATPAQLGLPPWAHHVIRSEPARYGARQTRNGAAMAETNAALAALRESIELTLDLEGPAGGPRTREGLAAAVAYYDRNYSKFPPAVLAVEVHRCRGLVNQMLGQPQTEASRGELRHVAGWLSALLGNLAFHLDDHDAATLHLSTAGQLGADIGDTWLMCWTLGARAMIAHYSDRNTQAVDLARQACDLADTPLRRAQMLTWALLRPTAALGATDETAFVSGQALDALANADDIPGRFGFDQAECELHLGESALLAGDHAQARRYAEQSLSHIPEGRPGWVAAQIVLARSEAVRHRYSDAAALAVNILDTVNPETLRGTSRDRLRLLNGELRHAAGGEVQQLRDRLTTLPALVPPGRISTEPNGT